MWSPLYEKHNTVRYGRPVDALHPVPAHIPTIQKHVNKPVLIVSYNLNLLSAKSPQQGHCHYRTVKNCKLFFLINGWYSSDLEGEGD